jgi:hypothetical protein
MVYDLVEERKKSDDEFDATIDDEGRIVVPGGVAKRFAGKRIHVRLSSEEIAAGLQARGVAEDEVEEIVRVQLESRDQVVKFLMTEGALRKSKRFASRMRGKR